MLMYVDFCFVVVPALILTGRECACARRPGVAASMERRRRERRTLLAGAAGELAGAARLRQRQAFERMLWSQNSKR
jgi:hypothetical protein